MSAHRHRRTEHDAAARELLHEAGLDDQAGTDALTALLAAATAPGREGELAGEDAAVAAFREAGTGLSPVRRHLVTRSRGAAVIGSAAALLTALALVTGGGSLPGPHTTGHAETSRRSQAAPWSPAPAPERPAGSPRPPAAAPSGLPGTLAAPPDRSTTPSSAPPSGPSAAPGTVLPPATLSSPSNPSNPGSPGSPGSPSQGTSSPPVVSDPPTTTAEPLIALCHRHLSSPGSLTPEQTGRLAAAARAPSGPPAAQRARITRYCRHLTGEG
ncbi:hypothetical protein AQ490_08240 [Wenjunlia vitaminophila]|uniref:Uncharacterized protein n=1 Tax=Wenjunlia vitaminophila TaxID=76728 RepID=A0A0T6LN44_WENVI|nr:hypothetical protein [Wenjunlia vitaminophila]KRV47429.1 hypothetical protein AQ490_08240 [Wenjunlia vitaminophila]